MGNYSSDTGRWAGGGSGGSILIEGNTISGTGAIVVSGGGGNVPGGIGRSAIFYAESYSSSMAPNYLANSNLGDDTIFNSSFETGNLNEWSSSQTNSGNLEVVDSTAYWGHHGMSATLSDNNDQYVQDDSPNAEKEFHAGFYFDPNSLTMASGDVLDLLTGYSGTDPVVVLQLQKVDSTFKVRIRALNDNDAWSEAATWQSITDGWNNLEIDYLAADLSGRLVLRLAGATLQSLSNLDTGSISIDSVRLGTMGVETGTRGAVFFDDYQSRRFSLIGPLPDPGLQDPKVTPVVDWINKAYTYGDDAHKHAVTSVVVTDEEENQTTNTYVYDNNGNMTCRAENGAIYLQTYNAENRLDGIALLPTPGEGQTYDCSTVVSPAKTWTFTYDGDGVKVKQVTTEGAITLTTYYYAGGSYEVQTDGNTETIRSYYAIAGMTIAMREGETWSFFLTDHLGSVIGITDSTGALISETRYLPFGEVRTDVGIISETDYGYTFQQNVTGSGLIDYKARSYDPWLGRFTQPDTIVPGTANPQSYNRYAYVLNNPIRFNDPTGHWWDCKTGLECLRIPDKLSPPKKKIGIFCGASGSDVNPIGPICPSDGSMEIWNEGNIKDGFEIISSGVQYPGTRYEKLQYPGLPNKYYGKKGQSDLAVEVFGNTLPDIIIGYSAGADSAILYAENRKNQGNGLDALVLLGPALFSSDYDTAAYIQKINDLHINVLIIDETMTLEAQFKKGLDVKNLPANITIMPSATGHTYMDDNLENQNNIFLWLSDK